MFPAAISLRDRRMKLFFGGVIGGGTGGGVGTGSGCLTDAAEPPLGRAFCCLVSALLSAESPASWMPNTTSLAGSFFFGISGVR
jgi:hypothetical protein